MQRRSFGIFIHVGALGDLLVSTAALYESLQKNKAMPFSIVGSELWTQILHPKTWPQIQAIYVVRRGQGLRKYEPIKNQWVETDQITSFYSLCKQAQVTINLRFESFRFAWAPWLAGVPERYGSAPSIFGFLYTKNAPWLGKDPLIHERDAKLRIVDRDLVLKWKGKSLPPLKEPSAEAILGKNLQIKNYVLINPTASRREKSWPSEMFRQVAQELRTRRETVVIIGAPNETEWLREVAKEDFLMVQPENISKLCDWVAGAKLLLANTSSVQFIAAGFATPVLTLMGRAKAEIWGPLGLKSQYLNGSIDPALDSNIFNQELAALKTISVETVTATLEKMLKST